MAQKPPVGSECILPVFVRNAKADDKALDARVTELATQHNGMMVSAKVNDPSATLLHTTVIKRLIAMTMSEDKPRTKRSPPPKKAQPAGRQVPKDPAAKTPRSSEAEARLPAIGLGNGNKSKKAHMDEVVMPLLLKAMTECAKQKPAKPIEFIANYLEVNNPDKRN